MSVLVNPPKTLTPPKNHYFVQVFPKNDYAPQQVIPTSARHRFLIDRLADDRKAINRSGLRADSVQGHLNTVTRKHGNWMKDQLNKIAKQVVLYAQNHKVTELQYDDLDHSFIESFTWNELETLIAQKYPEFGIGFVDLNPPDSKREDSQRLVSA